MTQNPILIYTNPVPETTGTGFDSLNSTSGRSASKAVFLCPYAIVRLLWAGDGREASACRDLVPRSVNPAIYPPTPFDSGERGYQPVQGAAHG
ncbi:MAG: hypothetical protein PHN76_05760 [Advenella sp.]|uniref:hypothetical protein n=1 Tax=Advenella sp. TaxID=1872388 RepID=UPI002583D701|nr:hypothetical protein [Advenella sp.]MDD3757651.1 hypothetical protein [Advenella sp.]